MPPAVAGQLVKQQLDRHRLIRHNKPRCYIAPYAATSIAEYFMEAGSDVLIVHDDLTQHARAYRELSLLLRRSPGRDAFPGGIFYIDSRLLERATHLHADRGGGECAIRNRRQVERRRS